MSEVTLSVGGKWRAHEETFQRQQQLIAHLTNELASLRSSYSSDIELASKHRDLLSTSEARSSQLQAEAEEWKEKYGELQQTLKEREALIDSHMNELSSLHSRISHQDSLLLSHSQQLASIEERRSLTFSKLGESEKELEEVYTKVGQLGEELEKEREQGKEMRERMERMGRAKESKEKQCVALVKERNELKKEVMKLREEMKQMRGSGGIREKKKGSAGSGNYNYLGEEEEEEKRQGGRVGEVVEEEEEEVEEQTEEKQQQQHQTEEFSIDPSASSSASAPSHDSSFRTNYYESSSGRFHVSGLSRFEKQIRLLNEKIVELEEMNRLLRKDNRTLSIRFKTNNEMRAKMERQMQRAVEASARAGAEAGAMGCLNGDQVQAAKAVSGRVGVGVAVYVPKRGVTGSKPGWIR